MLTPERVRLQVRAVLVIYRAEVARLRRSALPGAPEAEKALRERSLSLLDSARDQLDGQAPWHPEVLAELASARAEVAAERP